MTISAARALLERATLVTANAGKAREIARILDVEVAHEAIDLPEIQSLDLEAVLAAKGQEAYSRLERPVIVDETSLELRALGGFPGPLVKWLLESVGAAGIATLAERLEDNRATARCTVLYRDAKQSIIGRGATTGRLVTPRGQEGFGWDPIFLPDGEAETYAEIDGARKDVIGHRGKALRSLVEEIDGREGVRA